MDSNDIKIGVEIIKALPTFAASVAAIIASIVAIYGINSWRREFKGKRQIELAEDALALFYEAKNAITAIRSPFSYGYEGEKRPQVENERPEQKTARDKAFVVFARYKEREQVFNKLLSMRYRFMAQIGKTEAEPFEQIRSIINEIFISANLLTELWAERSLESTNDKRIERLQATIDKHEKQFWSLRSDDEIGKRVERAVSDIEQTCKNIIIKGQQRR